MSARTVIAGVLVTAAAGAAGLVISSGTCTSSTPSACGYPDATNTGVPSGTTLTTYSGPNPVTTANTVIDGRNIRCLEVRASGVIIKNSYITCDVDGGEGFYAINCYGGVADGPCGATGFVPMTIQDSEITCNGAARGAALSNVGRGTAVLDSGFTLTRVNIHACENGASVGTDVTIQDSYIHDLYNDSAVPPPDGAHADGVQADGSHYNGTTTLTGTDNVTVNHNTIYGNGWQKSGTGFDFGTSAIILNNNAANPDRNWTISNNLLAGGSNTVYCDQGFTGTNIRVTGNHFSTVYSPGVSVLVLGHGHPTTDCSDEAAISGNVIHEANVPYTLDSQYP